MIVSVHSYTDLYEGEKREVEIGILYNDESCKPMAEYFVSCF
jgi:predicted N-formylglutamate amidohydrolase